MQRVGQSAIAILASAVTIDPKTVHVIALLAVSYVETDETVGDCAAYALRWWVRSTVI